MHGRVVSRDRSRHIYSGGENLASLYTDTLFIIAFPETFIRETENAHPEFYFKKSNHD
jgi:hypothetical protein